MTKHYRRCLCTLLAAACAALIPAKASALTIDPFDNAGNMASRIAGNSSGVTISNATYSGDKVASGYFSGGVAAGIGIESGIVLTSGWVSNLAHDGNSESGITGDNRTAGSETLDALIPGYTTYDAATLDFDFQTSNGNAYFNFVFGSDEYNEWVNTDYNDVFGFFLDGTAVANNVAIIPGTATPVSINNVNNGLNAGYYNDNTVAGHSLEYDGFTKVIRVSMLGLGTGWHHLDLSIADAGDHVLDSGVFFQGSSFDDHEIESDDPENDANAPVPEPATMLLMGTGLAGMIGARRKRKA